MDWTRLWLCYAVVAAGCGSGREVVVESGVRPEPRAEIVEAPPAPVSAHGPIRAIAVTTDGDGLLTVAEDLRRWDATTLRMEQRRALDKPGRQLDVAGDLLVVSSKRTTASIFSIDDLSLVRELEATVDGETHEITDAEFSGDGQLVAAHCSYGIEPDLGDGGVVATCLWDGRSGQLLHYVEGGQLYYYSQPFAFQPEGDSLVTTCALGLCVFDVDSFRSRQTLTTNDGMRMVLGWSPDGTRLAVHDGEAFQIHAMSAAGAVPVDLESFGYAAIAWAGDGSFLVAAHHRVLAVYDPDGTLRSRTPTEYELTEVHLSADGRYIAVEWGDELLAGFHVFERAGLQRLAEYTEPSERDWVPVAWHPTEPRLYFGSRTGRVGRWEPGTEPSLAASSQ